MSLSSIADLADKLPLVLIAYVGAFFPWAVVSAYDYINSEWKTVRQTRRYGIINLVSTIFPLLIVLFYAVAQAAAGEYTEMANAIVASCFICLHIFRTLWGLWQLHTFRFWVENSIINLRKLGIEPALSKHRDDNNDDSMSVRLLSDNILVNNTIIDNQVMHGLAQCHLILSDNILKQRPLKPIQLWLNWSTAFVAQLMPLWVRDFRALPDPSHESTGMYSTIDNTQKASDEQFESSKKPMTKAKDAAAARGRYFGAELAASASLHLLSYIDSHEHSLDNRNDENSKQSTNTSNSFHKYRQDESNIERCNKSFRISNPFFRDEWCQQDHMHDGRIRKAEMLNFAASNASILPFGFPHKETLHRFQELRHAERLTYEPYQEHLRSIISSFPIDWKDIQEMESFDINKLEWFLILLHIGQLTSEKPVNRIDGYILKQCPMPENDIPFGAISNLQSQLGMENQSILNQYALNSTMSPNHYPFFDISSIPFGHHAFSLVSQSNKLVSKAGELIDIWLSLVAGQQISNMLTRSMTSQWEEECHTSNCDPKASSQQLSTRAININIEQARLNWRMADFDQCYGLADHYIAFMGYKMEYVRSFVALLYGVFDNCENTVSSFFSTSSFTRINLKMLNSSCVARNCISKEKLGNRAVQVDVLWQLQNQLEEKLEEIWKEEHNSKTTQSEDTTTVTELVLLDRKNEITTCLASLFALSFPSISVEDFHYAPTFHESLKRESVASFRSPVIGIKAICGAQNIQLELKKDVNESWTLSIVEGAQQLDWLRWKEAFLGRLIGCREWQKSMDLDNVPDIHDSAQTHISGGVTDLTTSTRQPFSTFSEWIPFRHAFALFELRFKMRTFREIQTIRSVPINLMMRNRGVIYAHLSDRRPVQVSYAKAKHSTLVENVLFIRECLVSQAPMAMLEAPDEVSNVISIAKKYQHTNLSRCLQVYEMAAAQYNSIEALVEYLNVVELHGSANNWISAISAIEGIVQRRVSENGYGTAAGRSLPTEHVQAILRYLNLFITAWGGINRREDIFNIAISLCVTASIEDGKKGILCLLKMLFYLFEIDNDISVRSDIAEYLFALYFRLKRESLHSQEFTSRNERMNPEKLRDHMASHTFKYPSRNIVKKTFIVRDNVILADVQEMFLLGLKNLANGILYQLVYDPETDLLPPSTGNELYKKGQCKSIFQCESGKEHKPTDVDRVKMLFEFAVNENVFNEMVMGEYAHNLETGLGGVQDLKHAISLLEKIIEKNSSPHAMARLANLLWFQEAPAEGAIKRIVCLLEKTIDEFSDAEAMRTLAKMLEEGNKDLTRDIGRAIALYERSIEQSSDPDAMTSLASLLSKDIAGDGKNRKRAVELLERATTEFAHVPAMFSLAKLLEDGEDGVLPRDTERAVQLYEKCIDMEPHASYMNVLGNMLTDGKNEVDANVERAVGLFERAIDEFEDTDAMWYLATLLVEGRGEFPRDIGRAIALYERSIEQSSDPDAMTSLAEVLTSGLGGIEVDLSRSMELLERAVADHSDTIAMEMLAVLLWKPNPDIERDAIRAKDLFEASLNAGRGPNVLTRYGEFLEAGTPGVDRNAGKAKELYEAAVAEYSFPEALEKLARIFVEGGDGFTRNVNRAVELLEQAISEGSYKPAMKYLAELLDGNTPGITADTQRAADLRGRARSEE